jgi:hypothetical protein
MAEFLTRDINLFVSETPEQDGVGGGFNVAKSAGSDFTRALMRGRSFGIPVLDKVGNNDLVGTGFEFDTELRPNYWVHPTMTIAMPVTSELGALWLARTLSGNNAAPSLLDGVGGVVHEHILLMQAASAGRQIKTSNLITSVGYVNDGNPGADFQFMGVGADGLTLSQTRADEVALSVDLVGSGRFINPLPAGVRATLPAAVETQNRLHGAAVVVTYTDGQQINLSNEGRVRGWTFNFGNNLRRDDRRPGDPFRIPNDPSSGAYVNRLLRGPRTASAQITVSLTESLREFVTHSQNRVVQNLSFLMKGNLIPGALGGAVYNYAVEVKMPSSYIRTIGATDDNDDAALTLDFYPVKGTGEFVTARVVNTRATPIS